MAGMTLVVAIGVLIVVQLWGVNAYLSWFRSFHLPVTSNSDLPKAAIILSIRGPAPFLQECLNKLTEQNYPDYEIHLVVDHPSDPANDVIGKWLESRPTRSVFIEFLENPSSRAYLKTSAVLQATRSLEDNVEVAVVADADTMAYPNWLRDLVIPQLASDFGLVSGNRWYDPTAKSTGALCRFFYNAICVAPMYFMGATWSGSMSMKRELFDTDDFRKKMADTPCEDAAILATTKHFGLRHQVQPDVMMYNREPCTLPEVFDFIKRQLLWTRLYHPTWHLLLGGTWALYILLTGALFSGVYHLATGNPSVGTALLIAIGAQMFSSVFAAEWLHREIAARIKEKQGLEILAIDWPTRFRLVLALPLAFVVICYAMLAAALSRQVTWSGITYDIVPSGPTRNIPPGGLRMRKYRPWAGRAWQSSMVDPLIPPLRDPQFLVDTIQRITGEDRDEVACRFQREHHDLGGNVRRAVDAACIQAYEYSPELEKFYADSDAFLYESLVWNRTSLKNKVRRWIGKHLAQSGQTPLKIMTFGDGLGIDAYFLAQLGHEVTYFDVSQKCTEFARQIFEGANLNVTMLTDPKQLSPNNFDAVLCLDVLEHVPDPPSLVGWLTSLLREGGELIVHAPFFYIAPAVPTHLRSNKKFSGDLSRLYEPHGLHPIAGRLFWDPIVLRKGQLTAPIKMPWNLRIGGALLKLGRFWSWPHIAVTKTLLCRKQVDL